MLHILVRHCHFSEASAGKRRPKGFSREAIWNTLLENTTSKITVMLDSTEPHFTDNYPHVVRFRGGSERESFLFCLEYAKKLDGIVVFLEDDYLVSKGWEEYIEDGLKFGDYVSLYDHPDKYLMYSITSKIFKGKCHWRTAPSTTNSYACKVKTLIEDFDTHAMYSQGKGVTNDHQKFLHLWHNGRTLVTPMPGFWSHEEEGMQSPL